MSAFARQIGVTQMSVTKYLAGTVPGADIMYNICRVTGRSLEYFIAGTETTGNVVNISEEGGGGKRVKFLEMFLERVLEENAALKEEIERLKAGQAARTTRGGA